LWPYCEKHWLIFQKALCQICRCESRKICLQVHEIFSKCGRQACNKSVSIGKFGPESGKMIPNNNYFRLFDVPSVNTQPEIVGTSVFDYGFSYFMLKCARETGLLGVFGRCFWRSRDGHPSCLRAHNSRRKLDERHRRLARAYVFRRLL
jgi:hypothetical protein